MNMGHLADVQGRAGQGRGGLGGGGGGGGATVFFCIKEELMMLINEGIKLKEVSV